MVYDVSVETFERVLEGACLSPRIHMTFTCLDSHVHKTFVCLDQHVHKSFTCLEQHMPKSFTCLTSVSTRLLHCFSLHVYSQLRNNENYFFKVTVQETNKPFAVNCTYETGAWIYGTNIM